MSRRGNHAQPRDRARALHEQTRLDRAGIFVSDDHVRRHLQRADLRAHARDRRAHGLYATLDVRRVENNERAWPPFCFLYSLID